MLMKFGINIFGKKAERPLCENFLFPSRLKLAAVLWVFYAVTVKRIDRFLRNLDSLDMSIKPQNLTFCFNKQGLLSSELLVYK